jgi:DNA-binding transcriptional regulator YhcF (GntR family)
MEVKSLKSETGEIDPQIRSEIMKLATEGRLSCLSARELAERLGVAPSVIGMACNNLRIKIKGCVLGCF